MAHGRKSIMSTEVLERTVGELARVQSKPIYLWHGGEALLAGREFFDKVIQLQLDHGVEAAANSIQSNGVLIDEQWANFFSAHNFTVGISIDGTPGIHDSLRKFQNGRGSHAAVLRGIEKVHEGDVQMGVLVVVTKQSVDYPEEIFSFLMEHGLKSLDFKPCYGDPRYDVSLTAFADFLIRIFDLWVELDDSTVSVRTLEGIMMNLLGGGSGLCTLSGSCTDLVTIDYDGSVYPCDRFMTPEAKYGDLMTHPLDQIYEESTAAITFRDRVNTLRESCQTCVYQKVCKGGCTQEREYWPNEYCIHRAMLIDHVSAWLQLQGREVIQTI